MEYDYQQASRINAVHSEDDSTQIFHTLRSIDLNLLTVFEAVYIHKGIVNAARILNLTPSAISQSIKKLRSIFPDPLFIRRGQGVVPTSYATHLHEYISHGLESILGALDLTGIYNKQRTITIGTSPTIGAVVLPPIYAAIKEKLPNLILRNIPVTDIDSQLGQFQTDLIIDSHSYTPRALNHNILFRDRLVMVARNDHPALQRPFNVDTLGDYQYTLLTAEGAAHTELRSRVQSVLPESLISVSSYNLVTMTALISSSDLLGVMPESSYSLLARCWPIQQVSFPVIESDPLDISLYYNNLSLQDPTLESVIKLICDAFPAK